MNINFTQEDPIGLAGGLNLYGYAAGDPINLADPFGLCPADGSVNGDISDCQDGVDWTNPTGRAVRGCCAGGDGGYVAPRGGGRLHHAIDFLADAGQDVFAVTSGVVRLGWTSGDAKKAHLRLIEIVRDDGVIAQMHYVKASSGVRNGTRVRVGQVVGTAQSLLDAYDAEMPDHVHVQIFQWRRGGQNGPRVDPLSLIPSLTP